MGDPEFLKPRSVFCISTVSNEQSILHFIGIKVRFFISFVHPVTKGVLLGCRSLGLKFLDFIEISSLGISYLQEYIVELHLQLVQTSADPCWKHWASYCRRLASFRYSYSTNEF